MVLKWSKFGSKIKLEWRSVLWCSEDFLVMVEVSESEIISSSSEVKRILSGDLSKDLLWGVWSVSGVFMPEGDFDSETERGCGVLEGYGEGGSQSYERVER